MLKRLLPFVTTDKKDDVPQDLTLPVLLVETIDVGRPSGPHCSDKHAVRIPSGWLVNNEKGIYFHPFDKLDAGKLIHKYPSGYSRGWNLKANMLSSNTLVTYHFEKYTLNFWDCRQFEKAYTSKTLVKPLNSYSRGVPSNF